MRRRNLKRHIIFITAIFMAVTAARLAMPQKAAAAIPTVKIGGVSVSAYNDNKWHAYNAKKPTISGWTAGKYKLSADGKTLYVDGFKYSGKKRGISSTAALKVVASGTNTFTCNGARGICLENSDEETKNLTLAGASNSTITIKCTDAMAIAVNSFTLSSGTVNATGRLNSDYNISISGGKLTVTGNASSERNVSISGGTTSISGYLYIYNNDGSTGNYTQSNGTLSVGKELMAGGKGTVSGGSVTTGGYFGSHGLTLSKGSLTSKGDVYVWDTDLTGTGGTMTVAKELDVDRDLILKGANITVQTKGSVIRRNVSMTGGSLTSTCSTADAPGIQVEGSLTVSGGTLTGKNTSTFGGIYVNGNTTVSGTGKVSASASSYSAMWSPGTLSVGGGTVETVNNYSKRDEYNYSSLNLGNLKVTGGTVDCRANGISAEAIYAADINVSGGTVKGSSSDVAAVNSGSITVSGGTLSGTNNATGDGVSSGSNLNISGTGAVSAVSKGGSGVSVTDTISMDGGSLSSRAEHIAIFAGTITVKSGQISGSSSKLHGISANDLNVSGGTVLGECTASSDPRIGIAAHGTFTMTGGKVTGKSAGSVPVYAPINEVSLADDIWMSEPADGYNSLNNGYDNFTYLDEFEHNGTQAKTATFQKVTSMSVKSAPWAALYEGDLFDPYGLVLSLGFEDGTVSDLSYSYINEEMFSFSLSQSTPLSAGTYPVDVTCLTKTATFDLKVRAIEGTTLSGTPYIDRHLLKWTPAAGATRYILYGKKEGQSSFSEIGTFGVYQIYNPGLSPGETWEYFVRPKRESTSGTATYGPDSRHVTLTCVLDAPVISASASGYDSVTLEWEDTIGATSYDVYRSADGSFTYCGSVDGLEDIDDRYISGDYTVTFTDTGLTTGKEYSYYVIAAIPDKNLYSEPSNTVKATPVFTGKAVLELSGEGPFTLSWEAVDGATGYEVMRGDGKNGKRSVLTSTDAETTSFTDEAIDIYSVYNYTVVPLRTVGETTFRGQDSNVVVTKAKDKPAPVITPPKTDDPKGTKFNQLQARAGKVTKSSVQIKWKKVKGAKKYVVYGNKCGAKNKYKKLSTTTKVSLAYKKVAGKKVRKGTYYKFIVYALGSNGRVISTSKTVHVVTPGGRYGNDKKVITAAKKGAVTLKTGKTFTLRAKAIPVSKKHKVQRHRGMAYETSNKKIATVSKKGVIKATGKGTCYVYAYTQNGVFAKVKVIVR